ncbi:methyltransferase domain-containing protein [Leptolyngbya iicbica]|uniref:Methyltransferase domain-containing protein n=2 Tax=Cyanophyceae TaxID=3028117 RepID=A0A4Q7EGI5_9CYAN|nr:methyltransferase domain-containing protein [Leptolyngbya sp. LK]RZM82197.1 methyltransferase domain-containing protein [Leptolyngbya sp. LK]
MSVPLSSSADRDPLSADFWEGRYQNGTARWDLGKPAPALVDLLTSSDGPQPGRAVVLGSGSGHDAVLFAQHGFEVTGVDFAPAAIAAASQRAANAQVAVDWLQHNIFDLVPTYAQQFDYVVEHTCFCALEPNLREPYVQLVHQLLKPGGQLIGVFFTHSRPGGPPFGSQPDELRRLFGPHFELRHLAVTPHSVRDRLGEEHLGLFDKR